MHWETPGRAARFAKAAQSVVFFSSCPVHLGSEYGSVAQLVAHLHGMQGVRGSSPLRSTMKPRYGGVFSPAALDARVVSGPRPARCRIIPGSQIAASFRGRSLP